jgi:hypothetical protein
MDKGVKEKELKKEKKSFLLILPKANYEKLKKLASERNLSVNSFINLILYNYLKNNEKEEMEKQI